MGNWTVKGSITE